MSASKDKDANMPTRRAGPENAGSQHKETAAHATCAHHDDGKDGRSSCAIHSDGGAKCADKRGGDHSSVHDAAHDHGHGHAHGRSHGLRCGHGHSHGHSHDGHGHSHGGAPCHGHGSEEEELEFEDPEQAALEQELRVFVHNALPNGFADMDDDARTSFLTSKIEEFQEMKRRQHVQQEAKARALAETRAAFPRECSAETRTLLDPAEWVRGFAPLLAAALKTLHAEKAALLGGMVRASGYGAAGHADKPDLADESKPEGTATGDGAIADASENDEGEAAAFLRLFMRETAAIPAAENPDAYFTEVFAHLYRFQLFSPVFTDRLMAATEEAEAWTAKRERAAADAAGLDGAERNEAATLLRPNSMNRYGLLLGFYGFDRALRAVNALVLQPLAEAYFPWVTEKDPLAAEEDDSNEYVNALDQVYAFTVKYRAAGATPAAGSAHAAPTQRLPPRPLNADRLSLHVDDSHLTLNVCLGPRVPPPAAVVESDASASASSEPVAGFTGGDLYLAGHRCEAHNDVDVLQHSTPAAGAAADEPSEPEGVTLSQAVGTAFVHVGRLRHAALPIETGTRLNLILWSRCSAYAQRLAQGESAHLCTVCDAQDALSSSASSEAGDAQE